MNSLDDARRFVARMTDEERNRLKQAIVEYEVQAEKIRESLRDESEAADHADKP